MRSFGLPDFAAHLDGLAAGIAAEHRILLDRAARVIKAEAKQTIVLHQNAIGPSAPREGELRDSIEHTVLTSSAHVGSNLSEAETKELGCPAIPPQAFLSGSAFRKVAEVRDLIGDRFSSFLAGAKR